MNKQAYWQGYAEACQAHGVDPQRLTKSATGLGMGPVGVLDSVRPEPGWGDQISSMMSSLSTQQRAALAGGAGGAALGGLGGYAMGGGQGALLGGLGGGAAGAGLGYGYGSYGLSRDREALAASQWDAIPQNLKDMESDNAARREEFDRLERAGSGQSRHIPRSISPR